MRRASFAGTKFGGGGTPVVERFAFTTGQEARAGPEGETSFPYGVNKNSSFLPARAKIIKIQRPDFPEKRFAPVVEASLHYGVKISFKTDNT